MHAFSIQNYTTGSQRCHTVVHLQQLTHLARDEESIIRLARCFPVSSWYSCLAKYIVVSQHLVHLVVKVIISSVFFVLLPPFACSQLNQHARNDSIAY